MKLKSRPRLTLALVVATALAALGFTWFQGFEIDTSHWFQDSSTAVVNRVSDLPAGSTSTPYNTNKFNSLFTSVFADPINAATDDFLGRVQSAVKTGHCYVDITGAIGPSLRCEGPYTDFNLTPAFFVAAQFPSGGYTDQIDIYLDAAYAANHRDCSTAPCNPPSDTSGLDSTAVNTACVPSGDVTTIKAMCTAVQSDVTYQCTQTTDCEGSRFTWTVGLNDESGSFHRDYVFQVGALAAGQVAGCPNGGYSVNAQYNSFRSGGNPYQGFNTKCIPTSGWYTFKQVFTKNASGNLQVDWSIADQATGNTKVCRDPAGDPNTPIDCTWSASRSDDSIDNGQIGCPSYGWLANEEINDLAIDNTKFETFGGDCGQPTEHAQITPTNTTCQQFRDGQASTLEALQYTLKGSNIISTSPGVFFYYTTVTGTTGDTVFISQDPVTPPGSISIMKSQAIIYSSKTCTKVGSLNITGGTASGALPSTGSFIIGVKYDPASLKGKNPPTSADGSGTYTFDTEHPTGTQVANAQIELEPRPK
jgi:hypothetical protein